MKIYIERQEENNAIKIKIKDNAVLVTAPTFVSNEYILQAVKEHKSWINSRLKQAQCKCNHNSSNDIKFNTNYEQTQNTCNTTGGWDKTVNYFNYTITMICGKEYFVEIGDDAKSICVGNKIYMSKKNYNKSQTRAKEIKQLLIKLAKQYLTKMISQFGSSVSLCPTKIEIKNFTDNRWLKCTKPDERVVSVDFRVIQLPIELQKYLILHAFSHFYEEAHTENFWHIVSNYSPNYKKYEFELSKLSYLKDLSYN